MILHVDKPIPAHVVEALKESADAQCTVTLPESEAVTYIDPESFDFLDVYGEVEFRRVGEHVAITKYEFENNFRSFDEEAVKQTDNWRRLAHTATQLKLQDELKEQQKNIVAP